MHQPFWVALETDFVLSRIALWDCFGEQIWTQFLAQPLQ